MRVEPGENVVRSPGYVISSFFVNEKMGGRVVVELKDSQYQAAYKIINTAIEILHQAQSSLKRKEESSVLRRRIEEAEGVIKKAKRELRIA